eukprot:TRINITY_DN31519_c0_g1_i1.p1 TRINITY_DN31519_c0_g1~~TRINITY_DN31519_c0_g1_i1.p1  ORF type:complete len:331 (-),score=44.15 TRINITY_DN31519_c0_g1_i1:8-1000(-)
MPCRISPATALLILAGYAARVGCVSYSVDVIEHSPTPVLSVNNAVGHGHSPCNYTFNPAWLPSSPTFPQTGILVRAAECPKDYGGANDHIMFAPCDSDGKCGDLNPTFWLEDGSEDPRVIVYEGYYYNFYYAPGPGQNTVKLARTKTPLVASSWEHITTLPWHRNGCVLLRKQPPHYVLYGESPPLAGVGLATTYDMRNFTTINSTLILPYQGSEVVIEASTPPVELSTGDYLHLYAAGTPGWVPNGNYTVGWVILDGNNPSIVKQRSTEHIFIPTMAYERGDPPYVAQRKRVIFTCSAVPTGTPNEFRIWFGGGDAHVGIGTVRVTVNQ